jgi:hypothetical protein
MVKFGVKPQNITITVKKQKSNMSVNPGKVAYLNEPYVGDYEITPKITAQKLETCDKVMRDDLTINAIPYAEVSNVSNGTTVTIG